MHLSYIAVTMGDGQTVSFNKMILRVSSILLLISPLSHGQRVSRPGQTEAFAGLPNTWASAQVFSPIGTSTSPAALLANGAYDLPAQQAGPPQNKPSPQPTGNNAANTTEDDCGQYKPDCRAPFQASAYLGLAIDTFAAAHNREYLNPNAAPGKQERAIGGFDFEFRLFGAPNDKEVLQDHTYESAWLGSRQLWIYGETVHGTRSAELDCSQAPAKDLLACTGNLAAPTNNPGNQLLYIIRNASSLEGFVGIRYEFLSLQPGTTFPATIYVKAQAGFITISGASAVKDIHHLGLGALVTKNQYQGSHLELGWGRNDLFPSKPRGRWNLDGYLQRRLGTKDSPFSFFAQITVDTDLGYGADSVQTYIGFNFSLDKLWPSN